MTDVVKWKRSVAAVRVRGESGEFSAETVHLDQPGFVTATGAWVRFSGPYQQRHRGRRQRLTWPAGRIVSIAWHEVA